MSRFSLRPTPLYLVAAMLYACSWVSAYAQDAYSGKTFRVTGTWNGTELVVSRIQLRDAESDPQRVRAAGRALRVDVARRVLQIGPFWVHWDEQTQFEGIEANMLKDQTALRVLGKLTERGRLLAGKIEAEEINMAPREVQLTALAQAFKAAPDGRDSFDLAGVPTRMPRAGYNRVESLTRRQDSRRPEQGFGVDIGGRRLTLGGEYVFSYRERDNFELDDTKRSDLGHELKLEAFYPYSANTFLFADAKLTHERDLRRNDGGDRESDSGIQRGQAWVLFDGLARERMGVQLGRQNFKETREWWWDDDLDAARVYFDEGPLHAELGLAKELARESSLDDGIDPAQEDVYRVIGQASWLWASRQALEVYALHQDDRSSRPGIGSTLRESREDASDARLTWLGVRAIGQRATANAGDFRYWADVGLVRGRETAYAFDDAGDGRSEVTERAARDVRGQAFDVGVSWRAPLALRPALTVGYARGSGDDGSGDTDRSFRQTGLHNNKGRFFGVNRFRYYGELLRPELSNLSVATLAVGVPFLNNSSVELVYHRYRQVKQTDFMRDIRIDSDLTGASRDIGQELDLVFGVREGKRLDLAFIASTFKAGDAFGTEAGKRAKLFLFELTYSF